MEVLYSINEVTPEIHPITVSRNHNAYTDYISYLQQVLANSMQVPTEYITHEHQSSSPGDCIYVNKGRAVGKSDAMANIIRGISGNMMFMDEVSYMYPQQLCNIPSVRRHKTRTEDLTPLILREVERRQDYYVTGTEPILPQKI